MKVKSLYVSVSDMDRAINFYATHIFKKNPVSVTKRYSIFDIDGFQFGLFSPVVANEEHIIGNNCVPTIEVEDVKKIYQELKSKGFKIELDFHNVGTYYLFQVRDSEENILEFYQVIE